MILKENETKQGIQDKSKVELAGMQDKSKAELIQKEQNEAKYKEQNIIK